MTAYDVREEEQETNEGAISGVHPRLPEAGTSDELPSPFALLRGKPRREERIDFEEVVQRVSTVPPPRANAADVFIPPPPRAPELEPPTESLFDVAASLAPHAPAAPLGASLSPLAPPVVAERSRSLRVAGVLLTATALVAGTAVTVSLVRPSTTPVEPTVAAAESSAAVVAASQPAGVDVAAAPAIAASPTTDEPVTASIAPSLPVPIAAGASVPSAPVASVPSAPVATEAALAPTEPAPEAVAAAEAAAPVADATVSAPAEAVAEPAVPAAPPSADSLLEAALVPTAAVETLNAARVASRADVPEVPSRSAVQAAFRAVQPAVDDCIAHEGSVTVHVVIEGATGRVTSASVTGAHADAREASCMARAASAAQFPPFQRAQFSVHYPFVVH